MKEALEKREDKIVSTNFLIDLMRLVLECNVFEFDKKLWIQLIGTAIGTVMAPTLANIFMARIDKLVMESARMNGTNHISLLKRFIDDFLLFWTGTRESFEDFMIRINQLHPTIKFTSSYDYENKSTTFLDMEIQIVDGTIKTDLYRKKSDKIQYLLPSSYHPSHVFQSIPYSLALRIRRICSSESDLTKRMEELKQMLIHRKYNKNIVEAAIAKAKSLERSEALKRVEKPKNERVVMVVKHHPALPSFSAILRKHWTTMTKEKRLKEIFPQPPMVAYQQPPNLKSLLVRAKIATGKNQRIVPGMKKCGKQCKVCSYVKEGKDFCSKKNGEKHLLKGEYNCNTKGVVYLISCAKCETQYVGQTSRKFKDRIREHYLSIINLKETAVAEHFVTAGHNASYLRAMVLEKIVPNCNNFLLEREDKWIKVLETKEPNGLNRID